MTDYKTTQEKAAEWNVSPQHIQYMCRKGLIEGAIKRGSMWFIPDTTPSPVKYTKSAIDGFCFVGTKSKIFDSAIDLFKQKGFNDVSLKDIADRVGIQQTTIYNHFESKQEILDTIYDFYCSHLHIDRPSQKDIELILQNGSLLDLIGSFRYVFKEDYMQKMSDISNIIFQRVAIDGRAKEISKSLIVKEGVRYVEEVFNRGIAAGSFPPFNTHIIAVLINCIRIFTLYLWVVDPSPENMATFSEDEQTLYRCVEKLVKDMAISSYEERGNNVRL